MKTKHDITLADWRGYGPLTIPGGTRVRPVPTYPTQTHAECWVDEFSQLFPRDSMQLHDATYYGIRVPASDCEE